MRTIIAGSREGVKYTDVTDAIAACGWTPTVVISGTARGVDRIGEAWAERHDIPVERYPADWNLHGKAAGPIRNAQMADAAAALIAVWDGESRGTKNMIETARSKGLKVYVHKISGYASRQ